MPAPSEEVVHRADEHDVDDDEEVDERPESSDAQADRDATATGWQSKDYGKELDVTATYKIYDNLSYMVGFGYLWAGDFWKGTSPSAEVDNDYLITHKLTLSF